MDRFHAYYKVLNLKPGASTAEIKQAYRDLVKQWHPDRFAQEPQKKQYAEEKIKAIIEAYRHLKDYQPSASAKAAEFSAKTTFHTTRQASAETHYQHGAEHVKAGRYKEALAAFSMAIRLQPDYAEAYRYRGFVHSMLGLELSADADLNKAQELGLEIRPKSTQTTATQDAATATPSAQSSPCDTATATQTVDSPVTSTNCQSWKCIHTLVGHTDSVTAIALIRNGKTLVSSSWDGTIKLWNCQTQKIFFTLSDNDRTPIQTLAVSKDGQLLASGHQDGRIKIWHLPSTTLLKTLVGHQASVTAIAISPDKKLLISGSLDKKVRIWNLSTGETVRLLDGHKAPITAIAFSPDGEIMFSASEAQDIRIYLLKTGRLLRHITAQFAPQLALVFNANGTLLATGSTEGLITLWEERSIVTGQPLEAFMGHTKAIHAMTFSPKGEVLATASADHTIRLWDIQNKQMLGKLAEHSAPVSAVTYSSDGQTIFSSSIDKTIKIWQLMD